MSSASFYTQLDFLGQQPSSAADVMPDKAVPPPADKAETSNGSSRSKPEKKRRRPALSCEQCRKRKIRCDRGVPCANCTKSKLSPCTYAPTHVPRARNKSAARRDTGAEPSPEDRHAAAEATVPRSEYTRGQAEPFLMPSGSHSGSTAESDASHVDALTARVRELEQRLADSVQISTSAKDHLKEPEESPPAPMKGTVSKTRFFGQSHWMNGADLLPSIMRVLEKPDNRESKSYRTLKQCKSLGRLIKENRLKPVSTSNLGQSIPQRDLADQLVDIYFQTIEGAIRILHGPTFRAEYDRYWQNPSAASDVFVMQLQLCMAIGATMYDDLFSLRHAAMQWIHEAQIWLLLPPEKSKMTIAGIQIMCMLCIAKATGAVGQEMTWVATGGLLRQAMYMGLHRDPKHLANMSVYRAEIRRRLWATILELNLQSSYDAGGPPLISAQHYDTQPPANLNDDQLSDEPESSQSTTTTTTATTTANPDDLTDMSVQLALFSSLPLRLTIIRHVNEFRANDSYNETLRLSSELNRACRAMAERLTRHAAAQKARSRPVLTSFHSSYAQLLVYRCFISLHQPMIARSLKDPTFYYSRKVALDCSLKMAQICGLSAPRYPAAPPGVPDPGLAFDRLITNGAGLFRIVPLQTTFSVALELIKKKEEQHQEGLGGLPSVMGCAELRAVLDAARLWAERRLRSGETNIKAHCFLSACLALVDALELGLPPDELEQAVLREADVSSANSLKLLQDLACREGAPQREPSVEPVAMEGVDNVDSLIEMPFDWMSDEFGWDGMGGIGWARPGQVPDMSQIMIPQF